MFVVTNREMREIDRYTVETIGIPSIILMENAGKTVADWIGKQYCNKMHVGVVCGKGNNGGDGLVIARHLTNLGFTVRVFILGDPIELAPDAAEQYKIAKNIGLEVRCLYSLEELSSGNAFAVFDILVDAMLGTGSRGDLQALYQQAVRAINDARSNNNVKVISVDNPTGLFGDHGEVTSETINADVTLALGYMKQSLITYPAADYTGEVIVLDIGIPKSIEHHYALSKQVLTEELISTWIPKRVTNSNKGTYGKVHCITGSSKYSGAGYLASAACLHIGAGLVYWNTPDEVASTWCGHIPELIITSHASENGHFAKGSTNSLLKAVEVADSVVIGCGIGQFSWGADWIEEIVNRVECPIVIDADAFTMLRNRFSYLKNSRNIIVTPHPGELAKVLDVPVAEIEKARIDICRKFAKEHQVTLVLKGAHTVIATPEETLFINTTGSHVLAKAGTGDVLAGFIGGLLAQGLSTEKAACVAVYCHGRVAEQLAEKEYVSTMASDVSRNIGSILQNIANRA